MKTRLMLGMACLGAFVASIRAADPMPSPAAGQTNQLVVVCDGDSRYSQTNVVWQRNVHAAEEGFYLECETLTAIFSTNVVRTNVTGATVTAPTNSSPSRFDRVIAETNVMIITRDSQILGDHAVYYASNEFLHVTGELVIASNPQGSIVCTNITFDRNTGSSWVTGPSTFVGTGAAFTRTNATARTNAPVRSTLPPTRK
jgi:hypothetical protein